MKQYLPLIIILALAVAVKSSNPIGALNYIGSGFDARKATYGLAPLIQFTYTEGKTWQSPYTKITFNVPDQLTVHTMEEVQEILHQSSSGSYQAYIHEYIKWYSFDIGIKTKYFSAGFEYNQTLYYIHEVMNQNYAYVMNGFHQWMFYVAALYPIAMLPIDPEFKYAMSLFPQKIVTHHDYEYAFQFVETFGTHLCYKMVGGAKLDFNVAVDSHLESSYTEQWITTQYGFYFHYKLFNVSSGGFSNQTDIIVNAQFLNNTNSKVLFYGGDPTLANLGNLTAWTNTLDTNEFPLNATFVGVWNFFDDPTTANTVKEFVVEYLAMNDTEFQVRRNTKDNYYGVGSGFNVYNLEPLAPVYKVTDSNTFIQYLPDSEFVVFNCTEQSSFNLTAYADYKTTSSDFLGFGSDTKEVYHFYNGYYKGGRSLVRIVLDLTYMRVTSPILPPLQLDSQFEKEINSLPPYQNSTQFIYFEFLNTWGEAVIDSVIVGGRFESNLEYASYLNSLYTINEISEYASWSFAGIIGGGHGYHNKNEYVNQEFNQSLTVSYEYIGGSNDYSMDQYEEWANTVESNSQPIRYHLQPIWYLISDPQKQKWLQQAINDLGQNMQQNLETYIKSIQ